MPHLLPSGECWRSLTCAGRWNGTREPRLAHLIISATSPFLSHHTTGYHPHPGILQGGQQHPREGPGGLPKQADVVVQSQADSLPCHPNQSTALKYGHWKASSVLGSAGLWQSAQHKLLLLASCLQSQKQQPQKRKTTNI